MRLQEYLHASRTVVFRPSLASIGKSCRAPGISVSPDFKRLMAPALFLLLLGGHALFAQAPPEPDANMDQPYNPNAQYDTGQQPSYAQSQPYSQQAYSSSPAYPQQPTYGQAQALSADHLNQLVAPIALYPDQLIALILAASTYPAQVADADGWRQAQSYASPDQIAAGANGQNWDPSVKALTAFPQVLSEMDANLAWTTALGNAYYNQPQDVLRAVQIMRQRAQAAGSLQSTPQQLVSYNQGYIQVAPANPQVVYVPAYNPWTVYGQPVSPYPGFSLFGALGSFLGSSFGSSFGSSPMNFGLGIAMTAFSHSPWGWLAWGLSWLSQSVLFNHSNYYSHSTTVADWGFPHGGRRLAAERGEMARLPSSSYRPPGSYARPTGVYSATTRQSFVSPPTRYAENRPPVNTPARGYMTPQGGYTRPSVQAYARVQPPFNNSQYARSANEQYGRSAYGSSFNGGSNYGARPAGYGSSLQ